MNVDKCVERVNARLAELMSQSSSDKGLAEAMTYSVDAGGKRIRPALCLMACDLLGGDEEECLDLACAIEMIHTYSLIHDDLPAMDNDDLRRGKPTSHVKFGEAMAILAGDGLLTYAFDVMAQNAIRHPRNQAAHVDAIRLVASCAGPCGMVAGQAMDLTLEGQDLTEAQVRQIYKKKTGALITASLMSGAIVSGADRDQLNALFAYGTNVGLAFQVEDDILDVTSTPEILGKTPGKDEKQNKATLVALLGVDKSREIATRATEDAVGALDVFGEKAKPLQALAIRILERDR